MDYKREFPPNELQITGMGILRRLGDICFDMKESCFHQIFTMEVKMS